MRKTITAAGVLLGIALIAGCATSTHQPSAQHVATQQPAAPAAPVAAPSTPALQVTRVHFYVTGTGEPSISYGSDSDSREPGHLGELSDGNALPWHSSMPFDGSAEYYTMSAQLEGPGNIHCKIVVTGPDIAPLTVASGHAQSDSGGAICDAQAAPSDTSGTNWTPEG